MPYNAVIKLFKTLLRFVDEDYKGIESRLEGPEMALNEIVIMLYVIDRLYYTIIDVRWGLGGNN
jgi:hypothetical protein